MARQKGAKIGAEGIRSRLEGGNKHWRFRQMLPMFQNKKVWFSEQLKETSAMKELLEEIKYTTYSTIGSKYDDGIDILSQINMIDATYPSKEFSGERTKDSRSVGMKLTGMNAKIWGVKQNKEEQETAYDSYNG